MIAVMVEESDDWQSAEIPPTASSEQPPPDSGAPIETQTEQPTATMATQTSTEQSGNPVFQMY
jgi:hypothetical protein